MTGPRQYSAAFVDSFPTPMEPGILYISAQYSTAGHSCPAGAGTRSSPNSPPPGGGSPSTGRSPSHPPWEPSRCPATPTTSSPAEKSTGTGNSLPERLSGPVMPTVAPWRNTAPLPVRLGSSAYGGASSDDSGPVLLRIWRRLKITVAAQGSQTQARSRLGTRMSWSAVSSRWVEGVVGWAVRARAAGPATRVRSGVRLRFACK